MIGPSVKSSLQRGVELTNLITGFFIDNFVPTGNAKDEFLKKQTNVKKSIVE